MTQRRYDLDWLRIAAFAILILYHCGMFYVSWGWHVKSSHAGSLIEPLMRLANPWRLTLLFLISGAATRFMADKMAAGSFLKARMGRLWPPLILAVLIIVPPQTYYEVLEHVQENGLPQDVWLGDFYRRYITASGNWCYAEGCIVTPTYNHMWFVAYLILYTLALIPLLPLLRRIPARAVSGLLAGPGIFLTPWAFLFATRVFLFPLFGESHDFRQDWYLHTLYMGVFLLGFGIAKHQPFFDAAVRLRWPMLALTVAAWAGLQVYYRTYTASDAPPPEALRILSRGIREAQAWAAILSVIGFFHHHFRTRDTPLRRTLSQAIFPFYLIHQTVTVVSGHYLDELGLPVWVEAPLLIGATALGCWLFYDLGRRLPPLRIWIGLPSGKGASGAA